jgi:hypothetical protein
MTQSATLSRAALTALLAATLAACSSGNAAPVPPVMPGHGLQVVELFQSQGCSSCPPANANVMALADRPDVLTLSWQVTYWDYLGWKDTYAQPAFTARQHAYADALHHDGVFTPQVVVNGRGDVVGGGRGEVEGALRRFDRGGDSVAVKLTGGDVTVSGNAPASSVYLVRYDPRIVQIPIKAGENGGRTLPHRNVVREVALLGKFSGGMQHWTLPAARQAGLKTAVLVQSGVAGPIVAAAHS